MGLLEIKNLSKHYVSDNGEDINVLKNLNMSMDNGEMVAVMGPSGSGKSTLLNIISGILKADNGEVLIEDNNLLSMSRADVALFRRHKLGMVFQNFNLIYGLNVRENIMVPMALDGISIEEQDNRVREVVKALRIEDIQYKNITEISGGEKQRTAIARAIINNPKIILADEPTGSLDRKLTEEVMEYFKTINKELGISILMVTHDIYAAGFCSRVVFLKDGKFEREIKGKTDNKKFIEDIAEISAMIGGKENDSV